MYNQGQVFIGLDADEQFSEIVSQMQEQYDAGDELEEVFAIACDQNPEYDTILTTAYDWVEVGFSSHEYLKAKGKYPEILESSFKNMQVIIDEYNDDQISYEIAARNMRLRSE